MPTHAGKVIWVTGASGALGSAVSRQLAREGATVIASSRTLHAQAFADQPSIEVLPVDVTNEGAVTKAAAELLTRHHRLDGLVASTNVGAFGEFLELDDAQWSSVIEAKLMGTVRVVRAALPAMLENGRGSLVVISGRGGIDPPPHHFPGSSVNAALNLLVQGLGRRYGGRGIRANAVAPGPIISPRWSAMEQAEGGLEKTQGAAVDVAMGRAGRPVDVAQAVSYLLSDASDYVNGSVLAVDGGGRAYLSEAK